MLFISFGESLNFCVAALKTSWVIYSSITCVCVQYPLSQSLCPTNIASIAWNSTRSWEGNLNYLIWRLDFFPCKRCRHRKALPCGTLWQTVWAVRRGRAVRACWGLNQCQMPGQGIACVREVFHQKLLGARKLTATFIQRLVLKRYPCSASDLGCLNTRCFQTYIYI